MASMFYAISFASGLIFAVGLGLSGMMDPRKVQGFLDLFGRWDPSLSLVMGGAVIITLISFPLIMRRSRPILDTQFSLPTAAKADARLLAGSVLFGAGWAISGLCPGPGLANLASLNPGVLAFVVSMLAGFVLHQQLSLRLIRHSGLKASQLAAETEALRAEQCLVD